MQFWIGVVVGMVAAVIGALVVWVTVHWEPARRDDRLPYRDKLWSRDTNDRGERP